MRYIDSHIHVSSADADTRSLIDSLSSEELKSFFYNSAKYEDWKTISLLVSYDPRVFPFFGIHPWYVDTIDKDFLNKLESLIAFGKCGVGEIGLDFLKKSLSVKKQGDLFEAQLALASKYERPVSIHCVGAWEVLLGYLSKYNMKSILLHRFTGSIEIVDKLLEYNSYFSICAGSYNVKKEAVLKHIPKERLLLETDYPYTPGNKGIISIEAYLSSIDAIYKTVASAKNLKVSELADQIERNAEIFQN